MNEATLSRAKQFLDFGSGAVTVEARGPETGERFSEALVAKAERIHERDNQAKEQVQAHISGRTLDNTGVYVQVFKGQENISVELGREHGIPAYTNRGGILKVPTEDFLKTMERLGVPSIKEPEQLKLFEKFGQEEQKSKDFSR